MCQNLKGPTLWHLRACLRVGMEPDELEGIQNVIEPVAAFGEKTLDVQRVADVTDAYIEQANVSKESSPISRR